MTRMLTPQQARRVYDRIGAVQDTQAFYENQALEALLRFAELATATSVVELGCGTGRLAHRLLDQLLPAGASYRGFDVSTTMVELARSRLEPFGERAVVTRTDGSLRLPLDDACCDRVVSSYVLDLLPEDQITIAIAEAARVLRPVGRLCLAGLTFGQGLPSRALIGIWSLLHRLSPTIVGGCRPVDLRRFVASPPWRVAHHEIVVSWAVPSEVLVALHAE